jgi:hypothetical protein
MGIDSGPEAQIQNQESLVASEASTSPGPRNISRRQFLKLAGMAGAAIGLSGGLGGFISACINLKETTTTAPKTTTTSLKEETTTTTEKLVPTTTTETINILPGDFVKELGYKDDKPSVRIYYDGKTKLPKGAQFIKTGKTIVFNPEEMAAARDDAVLGKDPKCVGLFLEDGGVLRAPPEVFSKEHPEIKDLPDDVVSEEKLKEYGVSIIQVNKTKDSPLLYIRQNAFGKDGIFAEQTASGDKLTIVVIDGYVLAGNYLFSDLAQGENPELQELEDRFSSSYLKRMLPVIVPPAPLNGPDDRFDNPEKSNEVVLNSFAESKVLELEEYIEEYKNSIKTAKENDKASLEAELKHVLIRQKAFRDGTFSESQLLELFMLDLWKYPGKERPYIDPAISIPDLVKVCGRYFSNPALLKENTIFLLVRKKQSAINQYGLFMNKDGLIDLETAWEFLDETSTTPDLTKTYSNPDGIPVVSDDPDNKEGYIIGSPNGNALVTLEHEEIHRKQDLEGASYNETDADQRTLDFLARATKRLVASGYTDDTGFPFVLKIPGEGFLVSDKSSSRGSQNA